MTTSGRTADNVNLDAKFIDVMTATYGGTRMGRQELEGELIAEVEKLAEQVDVRDLEVMATLTAAELLEVPAGCATVDAGATGPDSAPAEAGCAGWAASTSSCSRMRWCSARSAAEGCNPSSPSR